MRVYIETLVGKVMALPLPDKVMFFVVVIYFSVAIPFFVFFVAFYVKITLENRQVGIDKISNPSAVPCTTDFSCFDDNDVDVPAENVAFSKMNLYWVSFINQNESGLSLIALSDGFPSYEEALKAINWQRKNRNIVSAWIDVFDESNEKNVVFHECYIDVFGNIKS